AKEKTIARNGREKRQLLAGARPFLLLSHTVFFPAPCSVLASNICSALKDLQQRTIQTPIASSRRPAGSLYSACCCLALRCASTNLGASHSGMTRRSVPISPIR